MAISHSHLLTAERMLTSYDGSAPFPDFSRAWFRGNKKHGSRDRRSILDMCYAYFRLGASLDGIGMKEQITAGLFLVSESPSRALQELEPGWNDRLPLSMEEKLAGVGEWHAGFDPLRIFPWPERLSGTLDARAFAVSHLRQPALFARIRPGREGAVLANLAQRAIPHQLVGSHTLRFPNGTDLSSLFQLDRDIVVQDLSSQRVAELMEGIRGRGMRIWDCCAGSGGKSILIHDQLPDSRLSVSDIRHSILRNLGERFVNAGIRAEELFVADLEKRESIVKGKFDLVVADVPCTGSGTWGRNPEWLRHFDPALIAAYQHRQLAIARHAIAALKPGGHFLYITCSVFHGENEAVVEALQGSTGLVLQEAKFLSGYTEAADTLFAARFISAT
jgi:16S rRNA (cytosine967-C5)-methyltransferase